MQPFKIFFSRKGILALFAGIAATIVMITFMQNYILATVLGFLVAVILSGLDQPRPLVLLGSICGLYAGLFLGLRDYFTHASKGAPLNIPALILPLLGWPLLTGALCAAYGYLAGKFILLYKEGRGPFF